MENKYSFEKIIIKITLLTIVIFSITQFLFNISISLDESFLALNIIRKSHLELLSPLDYMQVAPILLLQILKTFSEIIPHSELGLRLFPLLSFLLTLFFFYKIITSLFKNNYTVIFSLSLIGFNAWLLLYASIAKQYIIDVFVLTSVYYFIIKSYNEIKYKYYYLGLMGVISIFLSNISPIILLTAGIYLLYDYFQNKKKHLIQLIYISIAWGFCFLFYYFLFIHNHPSTLSQKSNFSTLNAFMPLSPFSTQFYNFFLKNGTLIIDSLSNFGKLGGMGLFILILLGVYNLIKKKKIKIIILTITPFIIHLLLSSMKLYPFGLRFILYTFPCIIIICSYGFDLILDIIFTDFKIQRFRLLAILIPLVFIFYLVLYRSGFPITKNEIKPIIKFVEQKMNKKDKIFVNPYSYYPIIFYNETHFTEIDTNNIIFENRYDFDSVLFSNDINQLSGRVWFIFTKNQIDCKRNSFLKKDFNTKGYNIIKKINNTNMEVILYDIKKQEN